MSDTEQAIRGLKWLMFNFPWQEEPKEEADKLCNAIHKYASDAAKVLEKMEPAPPKWEMRHGYPAPSCSQCGASLPEAIKPNYCQHCGRAVKWE